MDKNETVPDCEIGSESKNIVKDYFAHVNQAIYGQ